MQHNTKQKHHIFQFSRCNFPLNAHNNQNKYQSLADIYIYLLFATAAHSLMITSLASHVQLSLLHMTLLL